MRSLALLAAAALAAAPLGGAVAAEDLGGPEAAGVTRAVPQGPDLELHVPRAEVTKLSLEVENLQAKLDIDTRVANLVQIGAGVTATVQKMKLQLEGVHAETHLVVRLDRVSEVLQRALATLEQNPGAAGAATPPPAAGASADGPAAPPSGAPPVPLAAPQPAQHKE